MSIPRSEPEFRYRAYVSEPITRCPPREKGRIRNLIRKIEQTLALPPYHTRLYIPSLVTSPEVRATMDPEHVYLLDRIRVVEADFMLVIADHTSFGIGGEVEIATALGKPVVIISRAEKLSRFLVGTPANAVRALDRQLDYIYYREWRDLKPRLFPMIEKILEEPGRGADTEHSFWDVGRQLTRLREDRGLSVEDLAAAAGLRAPHLRMLERTLEEIRHELEEYQDDLTYGGINLVPYQLEQLTNIGLPVLHKLAMALQVPVAHLMGDKSAKPLKGPRREAEDKFSRMTEARVASLKGRAAQYDVTFREYERLRTILVEGFADDLRHQGVAPARKHHQISEREFLDALGDARGML